MDLRDVLAKLKTENGLTTDQLSQISGVPKGTLNKLLNGETRNPTGGTLKKLADALNCPVELLYAREGHAARTLRNAEDVLPTHRRAIPLLGEIAAVVLNDEATLKRVYHIKNGLQLLSENPRYAPMIFTLDECDSIRILGKAVGFQSRL